MMLGEFLMLAIPLLIGMVPFVFAGRYLSGAKLLWLFVVFTVALFPLINLVLAAPFGSIEVIIQFIAFAGIMVGAIVGVIVGKLWARRVGRGR